MSFNSVDFFSLAEAKAKFSSIIEQSKEKDLIITKNGKPEAVIMNYEKFKRLIDFVEEVKDISLLEINELEEYKEIKNFFKNYDI